MVVSQPDSASPLSAQYRSIFALANGRLGVEGSIEELATTPDCLLPDVVTVRPVEYHEAFPGYARTTETRIKCPSPVALTVSIDDLPVDFARAEMSSFSRSLDLATGILSRQTEWRLRDGREIRLSVERLVPRDGEALIASHITCSAINFSGAVEIIPEIGAGTEKLEDADGDPRISGRSASYWTEISKGEVRQFRNGDNLVAYRQSVSGTTKALLQPGEELAIERIVEIACAGEPVPGEAAGRSFSALAETQKRSLDAFWANALPTIEGNDELTRALRFNLFQLDQSSSRSDRHSIAAKGLTGEGYEGHYFWDAETFMLPALVFFEPERARTLLAYRAHHLGAARDNARKLGHETGALYPWRTIGGSECSSHYPTGAAQYHINGDIAFALKLYLDATGDDAFLWNSGAEMLFETARIWMQIGQFDDRRDGAFCIYGVTGPDEYSALIDNDFYTNAVAKRHLEFAASVAERMRAEKPDVLAEIGARMGLPSSEAAEWRHAADLMWLPVDAAAGVNPQDDSFLSRPPLPSAMTRPRGRPLLMDLHPLALFRHRICKQGNVVQALAMDLVEMPLSLKERNFAFYEPITTHDSTLSSVAFAIAAAEIGDTEVATAFHRECALVDLEDLHHNTSHGLHMAAMAGSWLALTQGWGGMRVRDGALTFRPTIPADWPSYGFRLMWRGSTIAVRVDGQGAHYRLVSGPPVDLRDHARPLTISTDGCIMPRPDIRGVVFDLDGVLTDTAEDHYLAWQDLADRHGFRFDRAFNEKLKGVDRRNSLRLILDHARATPSEAAIEQMLDEKNAAYRKRLERYSPANLFPGVKELFSQCREAGLKIALASASRNAAEVVDRLGLAGEFDFVADAASIAAQKPAPDIFLACVEAMRLSPAQCVGVEDAQAGIDAIRAAGMFAIGVGAPGALSGAGFIVPNIAALSIDAALSRGGLQGHPTPQTGNPVAGEEVR